MHERNWQVQLHTREQLQTIVHTEGEQESAKAEAPGHSPGKNTSLHHT